MNQDALCTLPQTLANHDGVRTGLEASHVQFETAIQRCIVQAHDFTALHVQHEDVRIVTLVNAAAEERELPWANLAPWLADAIAVEALQPDGTLAPVFPRDGDTLPSWAHRVWVIHK